MTVKRDSVLLHQEPIMTKLFILGRDNLSHDLMQNLLLSLTNMKVGCFNLLMLLLERIYDPHDVSVYSVLASRVCF